MHCPECGAQLTNNPKLCSNCGQTINGNGTPAGQVTVIPSPETDFHTSIASSSLGTKWLKFWNYFSLPAGGILGLLMVLSLPVFGIIFVPIAILQLVVAYGLHYRRLWAWRWNWVLIVITYIGMAIPKPTLGVYGNGVYWVSQFVSVTVLGGLIWMWPNYVYWKKRRALFS